MMIKNQAPLLRAARSFSDGNINSFCDQTSIEGQSFRLSRTLNEDEDQQTEDHILYLDSEEDTFADDKKS